MTAEKLENFLNGEIKIEKFPLTAITGGGGKTTLMLAIAGLLSQQGRVVVTTTAKIAVFEGSACDGLFIGGVGGAVEKIAALPDRVAFTVVREKHGEKLCGFTPQEVDMILVSGVADWLLVEADGSRQSPLKAYGEREPLVPALTSLQFVIIGADAFVEPFGEKTAFRLDLLETRFGVKRGEKLSPQMAARMLSSRSEYLQNSPPGARRVLLLNKADILDDAALAEITHGLSEVSGYELLAAVSLKKGVVYETIKLSGKKAEK